MSKKCLAIPWPDLLGPIAEKDVGASVSALRSAFDAAETVEDINLEGLLGFAANSLQAPDPQRVLVSCAALLIALQEPQDFEASDALFAGVASALTSSNPLTAASAARCLCALSSSAKGKNMEERQEKLSRSRRVAPQLASLLAAHPKSMQVQEAVSGGCCEVLYADTLSLGGQASVLWGMLWPLAVHQSEKVTKAARLCICRLTWFAKPGGDVPVAEEAMARAAKEFFEAFKLVEGAAKGALTASAQLAQHQCVRLLSLLKELLLFGRSVVQDYGRKDKTMCTDDAVVVIPVVRIVAVVNEVVASVFRDSKVAARALSTARGGAAHGLLEILQSALALAGTLAEVVGAALLPNAARLRHWMELLTEVPPRTHWRHAGATCRFLATLAEAAPALLLNAKLAARLVDYALAVLQPSEAALQKASAQGNKLVLPGKKKRKAAEALESGGGGGEAQEGFSEACALLAGLARIAAPLLPSQQVANVCEAAARIVWFGLAAPTPEQLSVAGSDFAAARAVAMSSFCQNACRDAKSVRALLEVVQSLHQKKRPGVVPLAPELRDAFARLLAMVASSYRRRVAKGGCGAVGSKAAEVREALMASAESWPDEGGGDGKSAVTFVWPELTAPTAAAPAPVEELAAEVPVLAAPAEAPVPAEDPPAVAPVIVPAPAVVPAPAEVLAPAEVPKASVADEPKVEAVPVSEVEPSVVVQDVAPVIEAPQAAPAPAEPIAPVAEPQASPEAKAEVAAPEEGCTPSKLEMSTHSVAASSDFTALPEVPALSSGGSMELFPDMGSEAVSPIPSLCMDSPSDEDL